MRKLAVIVIPVALFAVPAVASARGGVDRSFGRHGRVIARLPGTAPGVPELTGLARAPRGRIVAALSLPSTMAATGSALAIRYLPNGRPDPAFGSHGRVEVPGSRLAPGASFQPNDVAVDSHGRVLLAGTVGFGSYCNPVCSPWRSLLAVVRLRPDGRLDPSFGRNGVTVTGFDLPGPEPFLPGYDLRPAVTGARILVKRHGAIVVAGTASVRIGYAGKMPSDWYAPLVARLTPNGHADLSFGIGGVTVLAGLAQLHSHVNSLALDSRGRISGAVCTTGYPGTLLAGKTGVFRLLRDGALDLSYGPGGLRETAECPQAMAIDPYRRTLVLLGPSPEAIPGKVAPASLERWRASGLPDRRFGRRGQVAPPARHGHPAVWQDVLAGRRERVTLGGVLARTQRPGVPGLAGFKLLAAKLRRTGRPDRRFGFRGQRSSGIGARSSFAFPGQAMALLDGRGRVVVAAVIAFGEPERAPLFLSMVRYLAGRPRR